MINMLRVLMDKVDGMQKQMITESRDTVILRENNKMKCYRLKNTLREIKNVFDGLISRLDIAEERLPELKGYINRNLQN